MKKINFKFGFTLILLMAAGGSVFSQWNNAVSPQSRVFAFKQIDDKLFAGTEDNGLWYSMNGGANWQQQPTGLYEFNYDVSSFENYGNYFFAGIEGGGICLSKDKGVNWVTFNNGFQTQGFVSGLTMIGDTLYAAVSYSIGMQSSGVYKTYYQKAEWKYFGTGMPLNLGDITSFVKNSNNTFFVGVTLGGSKGSLYVSTDKGSNWKGKTISGVADVYSLETDGNRVYAGTNNGIYYSDDDGTTWTKLSTELNGFYVDHILCSGGKIFAAVDLIGVLYSIDYGKNWHTVTKNLPMDTDYVSTLFVYQDKLFAAMNASHGIWSIPLSTAGVDKEKELPAENVLSQNYPNPFNPETTISYKLVSPGKVSIKIFDVLGKEIATIVNEEQSSGQHKIKFKGNNLSSGVYFYQLRVTSSGGEKSFVDTKKLILEK